MVFNKEEPVSSPCNIANYGLSARQVYLQLVNFSIAGDVPHRDFAVLMKRGGYDAYRSLNEVRARFNSSQMCNVTIKPIVPCPHMPR